MKLSLRKPQFAPASLARFGGMSTGIVKANSGLPSKPLIYVVDDNALLLELYAIVLENGGYAVQTFHSRAEALATLNVQLRKPDLLVTDCLGHSMPVGDFIRACRAARPGLRILMASGIDDACARCSGCLPDAFIFQPFNPDELIRAVAAVLQAGFVPMNV